VEVNEIPPRKEGGIEQPARREHQTTGLPEGLACISSTEKESPILSTTTGLINEDGKRGEGGLLS